MSTNPSTHFRYKRDCKYSNSANKFFLISAPTSKIDLFFSFSSKITRRALQQSRPAVRLVRRPAAHPELLVEADTIAVHPYPTYPPQVAPESEENNNTQLVDVVATMRGLTDGMPVMISEYGWPVWGDVDEEVQAQFLERAALLSVSSGVTGVCWYTLWDFEDPDNPEDNFGLLDVDGEFKPTADAFVRLADAFARSEQVAPITDLPAGAYGVHFDGVGDVLWGEGEVCGETLGPTPLWR